MEELQAAGAFDGIQVVPLSKRNADPKIPFYQRKENIVTILSLIFVIAGLYFAYRDVPHPTVATGLFAAAILIGGT